MKCFLLGILGFLLIAAVAAVVLPLYGDYADRAQSQQMMTALRPVQEKIAESIVSGQDVRIATRDFQLPPIISRIEIRKDGAFVVKGGTAGQVIVMIPRLEDSGEVTWQCIGGNSHAMPPDCR